MSNSVEGRVVIVTGSGRGIGRSIAEGLAQAGARVVIADIAADTAESTAAEIREAGAQAIGLAVDVTDRASTRALIARTVAEHGRLDAMFNNAGIAQVKPFNDITEEDWHRVMDVNALGVLIGIQEAARQFIAQGGGGKIVNTASIAGLIGSPHIAVYSASKHAVIGLTKSVAMECSTTRVRVNCVCPGLIQSRMLSAIFEGRNPNARADSEKVLARIPAHRLGLPAEVAQTVAFLASDASSYVNGAAYTVDGGRTTG